MKRKRVLQKIVDGSINIRFADMVNLVEGFGFHLSRVKGSHHIFIHPEISEPVNLQDVKGDAKPYQVKQFIKLVEKYNLHLEEE